MLVWLVGVPLYDEEITDPIKKQEMLEDYAKFVDSYVTCKRPENDILVESDDENEESNPETTQSQTPRLSRTSSITSTPNLRRNQTPTTPIPRQVQGLGLGIRRQSQIRQSQVPKRERQKLKICFQFHGHRKKNCMIKDQHKNDICKYNFPRPIMAVTTVIEPFKKEDEMSRKLFDIYYKMWITIRDETELAYEKYLKDKTIIKYDEFLRVNLKMMSHEDYIKAISCSIKRVVVFLKRDSHEVMINSFNKEAMLMWGSNMDIQEVSDPYGCASYVSAYMLKSNAVMSKLLRMAQAERQENLTVRQKLQRLANKFVNCQEVSAQEAVYTLLAMPVCQSSRDTIYVNTFPSKDRSKVIKDLANLQQLSSDSTLIYKKNLLDHYVNRPDVMESTCLAEFAACYNYITNSTRNKVRKKVDRPFDEEELEDRDEDGFNDMFENRVPINEEQMNNIPDYQNIDTSDEEHQDHAERRDVSKYVKLKNKDGYVMRRKTERVLRYKRYNQRNNKRNFFRVQNMLYIPWRDEAVELEDVTKDPYEKFEQNKEVIIANRAKFEHHGIDKIIKIQKEYDLIFRKEQDEKAEEAADKAQRADRLIRYYNRTEDDDTDDSMSGTYLERVLAQGLTPEELEEEFGYRMPINDRYEFRSFAPDRNLVISFPKRTSDQSYWNDLLRLNKLQFVYFMNFIRDMKSGKKFYHFIRGGSGTGKSFLIKLIYQTWIRYHQSMNLAPDAIPVHTDAKILSIVGAYTGKAAFNVRGDTVARLFRFQRMKQKYVELSNDIRKKMQDLYRDLGLIILDEVSMIGTNLLHKCNLRAQEFKENHDEYFGGLPVILVGDFNQIPPIGDGGMVYNNPQVDHAYSSLIDSEHWRLFKMFELTEIMRQRGPEYNFAMALNNIGDNFYYGLSASEIEMFDKRIVSFDSIPATAIFLFFTKQHTRDLNAKRLQTGGEGTLINCRAKDAARGNGKDSKRAEAELRALAKEANQKDVDILLDLPLKVGCKYMIVLNQDVSDGLTNGTTGILKNYVPKAEGFRSDPASELIDPKRLYFDFLEDDIGQKVRDNQDNEPFYKDDRMYNNKEVGVDKKWTLMKFDETVIKEEEELKKDFHVVRIQFQIIPCEALTIHKSQGQTYKSVAICIDQNLTQTLLYVAMSRVTTLNGLYFFSDIDKNRKYFLPLRIRSMTANAKKKEIERIQGTPTKLEMKRLRRDALMVNRFPFLEEGMTLQERDIMLQSTQTLQFNFMVLNVRVFNNLKRRFIVNDVGFKNCDAIFLISCGNRTPRGDRQMYFDYTNLHGNESHEDPFINIFNTHSVELNHQNGQLCFAKQSQLNLLQVIYHNANPDNFVFKAIDPKDAIEVSLFEYKCMENSSKRLFIILVYRHPGGNVESSFNHLMNEIRKAVREIQTPVNQYELIITGDFNYDFNRKENERRLHEIELVFGVKPMFSGFIDDNAKNKCKHPTHDKGGQLDWAFISNTRIQNWTATSTVYESIPFVSDHKPLHFSVNISYQRE